MAEKDNLENSTTPASLVGRLVIREEDTFGKDELYCRWWQCPACKGNDIWRNCNFCPTCGIALKFNREESPVDRGGY